MAKLLDFWLSPGIPEIGEVADPLDLAKFRNAAKTSRFLAKSRNARNRPKWPILSIWLNSGMLLKLLDFWLSPGMPGIGQSGRSLSIWLTPEMPEIGKNEGSKPVFLIIFY